MYSSQEKRYFDRLAHQVERKTCNFDVVSSILTSVICKPFFNFLCIIFMVVLVKGNRGQRPLRRTTLPYAKSGVQIPPQPQIILWISVYNLYSSQQQTYFEYTGSNPVFGSYQSGEMVNAKHLKCFIKLESLCIILCK